MYFDGASAVWTFGDGQSAQGLEVTHTFEHAGDRVVRVTVKLADGRVIELDKTIAVQSPAALVATFDHGAGDLSDVVNHVTTIGSIAFEQDSFGAALRLDGGAVSYDAGPDFLGNREYTVQFDVKQEAGDVGGYVAYFPYSFAVFAGSTKLEANITIDGRNYALKATGLQLADSEWHRVALTFSGDEGSAVLYLDGNAVGRIEGLGSVQIGNLYHDLSIGSRFGSTFTGLIDNFSFLRGAMDADAARQSYLEMTNASLGDAPTTSGSRPPAAAQAGTCSSSTRASRRPPAMIGQSTST